MQHLKKSNRTMHAGIVVAVFLALTVTCSGQYLTITNDLVKIIAYEYKPNGHRVVYVEQRNQNEDPHAKYLFRPVIKRIPARRVIVNTPPVTIVDVPAHAVHAPIVVPQHVPKVVKVPAPAVVTHNGAVPLQETVQYAVHQPMQANLPQPAHEYAEPLLHPGFFLSHGLRKRQIINPGVWLSPPVNCSQVYAVPPNANYIVAPDTNIFACECQTQQLTGTFTVKNEDPGVCYSNYDSVSFEGRNAHHRLCE